VSDQAIIYCSSLPFSAAHNITFYDVHKLTWRRYP
jgi:hypothetical protein